MPLPAPEYTPDFEPDAYWDTPDPDYTIGTLTNWDAAAELAGDSTAPAHETAAVLRMQRSGWSGPKIAEYLNIPPLSLVDQLNAALNAETVATLDRNQVIYDTSAKPDADN